MANNKISGTYILQTNLPVATYNLKGNDRNGIVSNTDILPNWIDLSNGSIEDRYIDFLTKNNLHIRAFRINAVGGDGLRTYTNRAALFSIFCYSGGKELDGPFFEITRFNEWQETDDVIKPFTKIKNETYNIGFRAFIAQIDDFNIQDAYINKGVKFFVEMKIETAGLLLDNKII